MDNCAKLSIKSKILQCSAVHSVFFYKKKPWSHEKSYGNFKLNEWRKIPKIGAIFDKTDDDDDEGASMLQ